MDHGFFIDFQSKSIWNMDFMDFQSKSIWNMDYGMDIDLV